MDDDPDPTLDQVILEGSEMNEQILCVGELQKCSFEGNEENSVHQESGDNGPFLEQEFTKKTSSGRDAQDLDFQTKSNVNIFQRKEQVDQSQTPDAAGSIKSSTTSLRKPSRRSLQWPPGQDSHHNSQQSVGQQTPINQKTSYIQFINEVDSKETAWINNKTGKLMKCRSQQTSASWERKIFSEILNCSSEVSDKSKGTYSEEDSTSTETTLPEISSESDGHQNNVDQERNSTVDDILKQKSCRSIQESSEESSLLIPKVIDSEELLPWISPKTGKEMKNKAQQTSILWELKTLSEILCSSQENFTQPIDTDTLEDAITTSGDTAVEQSDFRQDIQQSEESKIEPSIKKETYKYEQSQQTDSVETLKKELLDNSQQTDSFTDSRNDSIDLKDSYHSTQKLEAQQSRHGSQDSQRTVQNLLRPASQESARKQSEVLASLKPEQNQEPFVTSELDENTWISKKTGKVVKNLCQQTDKSWLQYCAVKKQKVKKCSSQQTDESFLQWYAANKMTIPSREDLVRDNEQGQQGLRKFSSGCRDLGAWDISPVEQDASRRKTSDAFVPEGLTNQAYEVQWPDESESRSTISGSSIAEDDTAQQTYSIISLEDGIWLNRRTGKILTSHSQQTSQTAIPTVLSTTSLKKAGSGVREEELQSPGTGKDETNAEQGKANMDRQQPAGKESHHSSQAKPDYDTQAIPEEPLGENPQSTDEVEKLLSTRLSEAMLLSAESPDMEDEPVDLYTPVKEGSWMNLNTGMVLTSQTQQTEEDAKKFLAVDNQLSGDTFQQPPEIIAPGNNGVQSSAGGGMDDDPVMEMSQG